METTRVYVSYYPGDTALPDYQISLRLIHDLRAAGAEVAAGIGNFSESEFRNSIAQVLPTCQWLIVVLTPQSIRSPRIKIEVDSALNLIAQRIPGGMEGIMAIKAAAYYPQDMPQNWPRLITLDAVTDYAGSLTKVLHEIGLDGDGKSYPYRTQPSTLYGGPPTYIEENVPTFLIGNESMPAYPARNEDMPTMLAGHENKPAYPARNENMPTAYPQYQQQQQYPQVVQPVVNMPPRQIQPTQYQDEAGVLAKPARPVKRGRALRVVLAVLVILLVLASIGALGYSYLKYAALPGVITSDVQASVTAQARAAAAAAVNTRGDPYFPYTGTLVLSDPLVDTHTPYNWDEKPFCFFHDNGYHVKEAAQTVFTYCVAGSSNYSDFAYQVQVKMLQGSSAGLIFRADNKTSSKFYYFLIDQSGSYNLFFTLDEVSSGSDQNLLSGSSSFIHTGLNQTNLVAVVVRGSTFDLYVNSHYLTSVHDTTFTSGQIGVCVDDKTNAAEAVFNNAKVWTL